MSLPRVSVIMTVYNGERTITQAVASVVAQTYNEFELVIIDDGSTDSTATLVEQLIKCDLRIRYWRHSNRGQPASRNVGLEMALGEYVAFLDADDWWLPEHIEQHINYHSLNPSILWSYSDCLIFRDGVMDGRYHDVVKPHEGNVERTLLRNNFICSPGVVIKKQAITSIGSWEVIVKYGEDWNMWLRLARNHDIGYIGLPLSVYRMESTGMTGTGADSVALLRDNLLIIKNARARSARICFSDMLYATSRIYFQVGMRYQGSGNSLTALRCYLRAYFLCPIRPIPAVAALSVFLPASFAKAIWRTIK